MAVNLYVMPTVTGAKGGRLPKYQASLFPTLQWDSWEYGDNPWCLVGVVDVPTATDTAIRANADVFALPQNLDTTVGNVGTRNTIRTQIETAEIPGSWVQTTSTYREIVRCVGGCCQFAQRYQGLVGGVLFPGVVSLDSTFGSLPQAQQTGMLAAAASLGFDTGTWIAGATLRTVMKSAADQYLARFPLTLGGVVL